MYKNRKGKLMVKIMIMIAVLLAMCIGVIIYGKHLLDEEKRVTAAYEQELTNNRRTVYVAKRDIAPGEQLLAEDEDDSKNNVMTQEIYTGLGEESYISEFNLGNIAVVPIAQGNPVMSSMVSPLQIDQDTREYEISVANLMVDQKENDYVDIRIMFPNGEDYLVISKKPVKDLHLDSSIYFTYLSEEEILRMASATIDAFTMTGAKIYTTRYIATGLQEEAKPNYLVRNETIDLMQSDPNILSKAKETLNAFARADLERRMGQLTEDQLTAVAEGHNISDTAQNSVLTKTADATADVEGTEGTDGVDGAEAGAESTENPDNADAVEGDNAAEEAPEE